MPREINTFENAIKYICTDIRSLLLKLPDSYKRNIEEVRLRNGQPLNIYAQGRDFFISKKGTICQSKDGFVVDHKHIKNSFQLITNHSVYAYTEEIRKGFITIKGGHRVGIGGKVIYGEKGVESISDLSSLNIRIAREKKGISDHILPYLIGKDGEFVNTLIVSAPQCGKTTLLRDLIRNLSNGIAGINNGFKIGLVDERSEVAGIYNGQAQKDVGVRTDILDGCFKADGIMMLIRSMSPEIIAVDEIGGKKDIKAIDEGLRAGIRFIATIHGFDLADIKSRSNLDRIINEKVFKRYIILDKSKGVGTISSIIEGENFKKIFPKW